jgi:hypothetical protein
VAAFPDPLRGGQMSLCAEKCVRIPASLDRPRLEDFVLRRSLDGVARFSWV